MKNVQRVNTEPQIITDGAFSENCPTTSLLVSAFGGKYLLFFIRADKSFVYKSKSAKMIFLVIKYKKYKQKSKV